ncbi:hypothetical protein [Vibrio phage phiKT1028]|nr:hypothetical protein [Vibrio phage phiKT1028]
MRQIYLVTIHLNEMPGNELYKRLVQTLPKFRVHKVDQQSVTIYSITDNEESILRDTAVMVNGEHQTYEVSRLTDSHFVVWLKTEDSGDVKFGQRDHQMANDLFNG